MPAPVAAELDAFLGELSERARAVDAADPRAATFEGPGLGNWGRAYRGAQIDRLTRDWIPYHRSGDDAIRGSWWLLTARIRDLLRNDPVIVASQRALVKHVIGGGIGSFAAVRLSRSELMDEFNDESDDLFQEWCEEDADAEGKLSWSEMQRILFMETAGVGECLLVKRFDPNPKRIIPLCYQLVESEQLDYSKDQPAGPNQNKIVRGVEVDKDNRPVGYWLFEANPYDSYAGFDRHSSFVPASRVIHMYMPDRPGQTRGISWYATIMQSLRDLDWYVGNELTAAAIGALLTVFIGREDQTGQGTGFTGPSGESATADEHGNPLMRLGRGTVCSGRPGDKFEVIESSRPNRDAKPFIDLIQGLCGMGVGMSRLRLTGDYSQSSYTSARGAHLDDQAHFRVLQNFFGRQGPARVRRDFTEECALAGRFTTVSRKQYFAQQRRFNRITLQYPGREQLDPEMETLGSALRIYFGVSTQEAEAAARGLHWRHVVLQQQREQKFRADHDVQIDYAISKGGSRPTQTGGDGSTSADGRPGKSRNAGSGDDGSALLSRFADLLETRAREREAA